MPRGNDDSTEGLSGIPTAGSLPEPPVVQWWEPNEFLNAESALFSELYDIHPAVSVRILKDPQKPLPGEDYFDERERFYFPSAQSVMSPEQTVPGMQAAGKSLARHIDKGNKIAIFTDYDPDGICGAEALRLSLEPYLTQTCKDCKGKGRIKGKDCSVCEGVGDVYDPSLLLVGYASASSGFGVDPAFVDRAKKFGAKVFITVDCGSKSVDAISKAKKAGMEVIVVDHHDCDSTNPADHHLNPQLYDPPTSSNTGAQLAWKLGMAVQEEIDGNESPEHWHRAMYLAGFGCRADAGDVRLPENRAFFWLPVDAAGEDAVPPGIALLADALGEDASNPGNVILTSACLNLGKRTPRVDGERVGQIVSAKTPPEEVEAGVKWLLSEYERAKPIKKAMTEEAVANTVARKEELEFEAARSEEQMEMLDETQAEVAKRARKIHAQIRSMEMVGNTPDDILDAKRKEFEKEVNKLPKGLRGAGKSPKTERFAHAILDRPEYDEYPGYSGIVASRVSKETNKPAIVFTHRGLNDAGEDVFKWSIRNESRCTRRMGELLRTEPYYGDKPQTEDGEPDWERIASVTVNARESMAGDVRNLHKACSLVHYDPDGDVERHEPSIGGHEMVVSGACTRENIPEVIKALEIWADSCTMRGAGGWKIKKPYDGPSSFLTARQAAQPGMSHVAPEDLEKVESQGKRLGPFSPWDEHRPASIGLIGTIDKPVKDPETGHYKTRLKMPREDGKGVVEREAWVSERRINELPADGKAEYVLNVDGTQSYFLTSWRTDSLSDYEKQQAAKVKSSKKPRSKKKAA